MAHRRHRLVVEVDGSAAAQSALEWALRQARWLDATVLVVTAWDTPAARRGAPQNVGATVVGGALAESPPERRRRVTALQQRCIAQARAAVGPRNLPVIGRELVSADPVTAVRQAGRRADMLVVGGGDRPLPNTVATGLRRSRVPVVVVTPPQLALDPVETVAVETVAVGV